MNKPDGQYDGTSSTATGSPNQARKLINSYSQLAAASHNQMNEISRRVQSLQQFTQSTPIVGSTSTPSSSAIVSPSMIATTSIETPALNIPTGIFVRIRACE